MSSEGADISQKTIEDSKTTQTTQKKRKVANGDPPPLDRAPVLKKPMFSTAPETVVKKKKKKVTKEATKSEKAFVYKYGNYRGYYGYRLDESGNDARIGLFDPEWFREKDVLDIGCNTGVLSIRVSKNFLVRSMLGVDIDKALINCANKNLSIISTSRESTKGSLTSTKRKFHGGGALSYFETSNDANPSESPSKQIASDNRDEKNIQFEAMNYLDGDAQKEKFDTVLCLSVIKWIHLNWGDTGLRTLLQKVFDELKPNGSFILEIQPISSYNKVKNLTRQIKANWESNKIQPDQIVTEATEIGFLLLRTIVPTSENNKKGPAGFLRPIHVFTKSSTTEAKDKTT